MREMVAAGRYYDRDPTLLKEEVEAHYNSIRGPGSTPLNRQDGKVRAIIVPNSPYKNCGDCMAWGYKEIAESPLADVYIIIATNQFSQENGLTMRTYETPLGMVRVDQVLAKALAAKGTIGFNDEIHEKDFPIEVQLPFLQHAKMREIEHIKILPILLSYGLDVRKLAIDLKEAIVETDRNPVFIVSTDFTHYGPLFHYVPFSTNVQEGIRELDKKMFEAIIAQDADRFRNVVAEHMVKLHGSQAVELLLRMLRSCNVRFLQYYTSGDIYADYKNSVSYATITFEEK